MSIEKLTLHALRNEQHYQFQTEFKELVAHHNPQALKIEKEFALYLPLYQKEDDTLKVIRKSAVTEKLAEADTQRDFTYSGLVDAVKAALKHFSPAVQEAAKRAKIVFDTYGNVTRKPYDEESAAITNILQELNGKYAPDIALLNLQEWVAKLEADNTQFLTLIKDRYADLNLEAIANMPQVRSQIDEVYRTIVERINALVIVEGSEAYIAFVNSLNQRIAHYRNVLKQRQGTKKEKKTAQVVSDN